MADGVAQLQRECARALTALRDQLDESEEEATLLRRKVEELTTRLRDTTAELEHRSRLWSEAAERADRLETQVADANKALLTREMRIHELTQARQVLEKTLETEQAARDHWEREFSAARDDVARLERQQSELKMSLDDRGVEVGGWKAKVQLAKTSLDALRTDLDAARANEAQRQREIATLVAERDRRERRWATKVEKRERAIVALQQQLDAMRQAQTQADARGQELSAKEAQWRSTEATQQLERRRQLLALQDQLQHASSELEKAKMRDILAQRELCRLREELLMSESQRQTDQRRHAQQLKGKEKEMAFVWQKYVHAMASKGASDRPTC